MTVIQLNGMSQDLRKYFFPSPPKGGGFHFKKIRTTIDMEACYAKQCSNEKQFSIQSWPANGSTLISIP